MGKKKEAKRKARMLQRMEKNARAAADRAGVPLSEQNRLIPVMKAMSLGLRTLHKELGLTGSDDANGPAICLMLKMPDDDSAPIIMANEAHHQLMHKVKKTFGNVDDMVDSIAKMAGNKPKTYAH